MNVASVLKAKGSFVVIPPPQTPLAQAAQRLAEHKIGAVILVDEADRLTGILSERDIVWALAEFGAEALTMPASAMMQGKLFTCGPHDSVHELMELMTEHRVRHLPVLINGRLSGVISIGDLVKSRITEVEDEARDMRRYIAEAGSS
jgi:CBS domain-containing protein